VARPLAVALTGGIGAGKSEALRAFERHGAAVISSDEIVHRLIAEDDEVRAALDQRVGTTDRARLAEVVFADPIELAWLEGLLHPRVRREYLAWLDELDDSVDVAVVEVPLLYETGAETAFDAVVVITASEATRVRRVGDRVRERSPRLIPDEEKIRRADFAFVNEGTLEELNRFVATVLEALRR
jgi:dephospho-CoA kinase